MTITRDDLETGRADLTEETDGTAIPLATPGEILSDEFLKPLGITPYRLAVDIGVPPNRIGGILAGRRAVTADTALRLGRYFGVSAAFWMNLQSDHDLRTVDAASRAEIDRSVRPRVGA
jgi:addiction module HigA family antidote